MFEVVEVVVWEMVYVFIFEVEVELFVFIGVEILFI